MQKPLSLLMISFHFPPISDSSGYLRALKLAKYLPEYNVTPTILTVQETAYETTDSDNELLLNQLPENISVHRSIALDSSKQLAIKGKYFSWMAIPDKWVSWIPFACIKAWWINRHYKFDALWVTYPISSSLFIGYALTKILKKPLYVDLRDPVWEEETWQNTAKQKVLKWIEKKVVYQAEKIIFTAQGTIDKYKRRYPDMLHEKFTLIPNGYDEDDFTDLPPVENSKKMLFLHSGVLPVYERDPTCFFNAIAELKSEGDICGDNIVFRLRATGYDKGYQKIIDDLDISELVELKGRVSYKAALAEMFTASYLMIFQHRTCDWQVPAKLFEYFRVNKPLLILAGSTSDTLALVKESKCSFESAEIDETSEIKEAIRNCITSNNQVNINQPDTKIDPTPYSRLHGASTLANLLKKK